MPEADLQIVQVPIDDVHPLPPPLAPISGLLRSPNSPNPLFPARRIVLHH